MGKEYKDLQHSDKAFNQVLSAPTAGEVLRARDLTDLTCAYTVANINTAVTVRLEGSLDGTNWFNLDIEDTRHTANGTYAFSFAGDNMPPINFFRFNFVSEEGGTVATITIRYAGRA